MMIDEEIDEKVFNNCAHRFAKEDIRCEKCFKVVSSQESLLKTPKYSTDIGAAFTVVEKMEKDGWSWSFEYEGADYGVQFHNSNKSADYFCAEEKTLLLAICKAALVSISGADGRV